MRATDLARAALAGILLLSPLSASAQNFGMQGGEPTEIESDKLEVFDRDNTAVFTGNVTLVQGDLLLKTVKMTVFYKQASQDAAAPAQGQAGSGSTEVERMVAEGKVYIQQGGQVVTGDRGELKMEEQLLVVTGKEVVLTEGSNVVVGCRFTNNGKSGDSQVDSCPRESGGGRVKMLLQPGSAAQP